MCLRTHNKYVSRATVHVLTHARTLDVPEASMPAVEMCCEMSLAGTITSACDTQ